MWLRLQLESDCCAEIRLGGNLLILQNMRLFAILQIAMLCNRLWSLYRLMLQSSDALISLSFLYWIQIVN
ncbi:hypothetical protein Nepgr_027286 [Nepenthes gracilis]|uniref:Uncharacterized protein n=1 Tax=Nepenthes gracilis TaxID=150966 RepID=A0AAD3T8N0_NEPGR|nr:hypothetical protein Nepgr_027286 [Nepenthes gracilis]